MTLKKLNKTISSRFVCAFLFILTLSNFAFSQQSEKILLIKKLPASLDTLWKFNTSDDIIFASPTYDDSNWKEHYNNLDYDLLDSIGF